MSGTTTSRPGVLPACRALGAVVAGCWPGSDSVLSRFAHPTSATHFASGMNPANRTAPRRMNTEGP